MRVLVTGASGHIGRMVCSRLLYAGHQVAALVLPGKTRVPPSHPRLSIHYGNTEVAESFVHLVEQSDAVIHSAGVRHAGRRRTYESRNVEGARELARIAGHSKIKQFIMVSSLAAQGPSEYGGPHVYPGGEKPCNAYGESLLQAEAVIKASGLADRLTILRPGMVYGADDTELLPWVKMVRLGVLPVRSQCQLSMLHVADLADFIVHQLSQSPCVGPFFLSEGPPRDLTDIVDAIENVLEGPASVRLYLPTGVLKGAAKALGYLTQRSGLFAPLSDSVVALQSGSWACEADAAKTQLGFDPKIQFKAGVGETVRAYRIRGLI